MLLAFGAAVVVGLAALPVTGERARSTGAGAQLGSLDGAGFAVLELFTSQGCSSCPPADRLLSAFVREHGESALFALSFHVDYWNHLGWRDPFSDAAFSARQRGYAARLSRGRVYTPQLVVNGGAETVGSRAAMVQALVQRALSPPPRPGPTITLWTRVRNRAIEVRHRVDGAPTDADLVLTLVQRRARTDVTRGENAAHTLRNTNVVRSLVTAKPTAMRTILPLPSALRPSEVQVIALLQRGSSGVILAAARSESPGAAR